MLTLAWCRLCVCGAACVRVSQVFIAEGWVRTSRLPELRDALSRASVRAGGETHPILNELTTTDTPPTYIRTSRFTAGFQALVDTYGIPRYGGCTTPSPHGTPRPHTAPSPMGPRALTRW